MSLGIKAATAAAFAITALFAVMASDASMAVGLADASTDTIPASIRDPQDPPASPRLPGTGKIIFAPSAEVVQPLAPATAVVADQDESVAEAVRSPATSLTQLVDDHGSPETLDGDMQCLAGAVYFESKGESLAGQLAVARVIINRMESGRFANSLCGVVYQPGQFSFVRGHSMPPIAMAGRAWREAVAISQIAMANSWDSQAEGALYFHARRVSPRWGRARLAAIDNHVFYR